METSGIDHNIPCLVKDDDDDDENLRRCCGCGCGVAPPLVFSNSFCTLLVLDLVVVVVVFATTTRRFPTASIATDAVGSHQKHVATRARMQRFIILNLRKGLAFFCVWEGLLL